jgi:hypothetical protein
MPRFYFDVLDGEQVITDLEGIDFADRDTAVAAAVQGARDLVASGIRQNEDVIGAHVRDPRRTWRDSREGAVPGDPAGKTERVGSRRLMDPAPSETRRH